MKGVINILGIILLAIIFVLVLNYFNVSIRVVVEEGESGSTHLRGETKSLWNEYLKNPLESLWKFILEVFWEPFVSNMERLKDGKPSDFDISSPTVPY